MRSLFTLLLLVALVGGGVYLYLNRNTLDIQSLTANLPIHGQVAGVAAPQIDTSNLGDKLQGVAVAAQKAGAVLGIQTFSAGQAVVSNLTASSSAEGKIDVTQTVSQIQSEVQKIPSTIVKQAQIEYCKQVLREASISAVTP